MVNLIVGKEEETEDQSGSEEDDEDQSGSELNVIIFDDEEEEKERKNLSERGPVLAVKRDAEGKPLPKAARTEVDEEVRPEQAAEKIVVKKSQVGKNKTSQKKKIFPKKKGKSKKVGAKATVIEKAEYYSLVSALANAPSGISFGQLLRGDAEKAKRDLDKLLSETGLKMGVVREVVPKEGTEEERCLGVAKVKL